jgi:hypothetical protein
MTRQNRRIFILQTLAAGSALAVAQSSRAQGAKLEETDPQAVALGYKHDTTLVDAKKYPKHAANQDCAVCQLYQGKATDATGPCALFPGKAVASKGWCSAWAKKAG